jgi:hypothetical protein
VTEHWWFTNVRTMAPPSSRRSPSGLMNLALRLLILGPVFLIAGFAFALTLPLCCVFIWLVGESPREFLHDWHEIEREAWEMLWHQ